MYENCCDLEEEAAYCHKRHLLALGFDAYVSKQFEEAEHTFSKLQNCGYPDLESLARNDLAFMIRRKETTFTQCAFWDTIKDVSDSHIFKHMNIVLFCRTEGLMDDPRYQTSIQHLKIMSYQDAMALYQCWSNTEMVGERESELALSIMMETADVDISSITTPTEA